MEVPMLGKDAAEGPLCRVRQDWLVNYKKMFGTDANTQAIIGYNAVETFAFYANKAGKDLTGQKMLDALESGDKFLDTFNSPPTKFSKTDHLANTITQVQQVKNGRWVLVKDNFDVLSFPASLREAQATKQSRSRPTRTGLLRGGCHRAARSRESVGS